MHQHLWNDSSSFHPVHPLIRAFGPKVLHHAKGHCPSTAWVTIDDTLHKDGELLTCIYSTDSKQVGQETKVELRNGKAVLLTVAAAGFVIYE